MADLTLGAHLDPATGGRGAPAVLDTADLTTHGVIVGMTGSGKTGLGVVLIEECLAAGVPAIVIDPKGDLTNLALTFPGLDGPSFLPWIDPAAAAREGVPPGAHAEAQARAWREGLAGWGITPERVAAQRDAAEVTVFTPGSTAGVPMNLVGSLRAPADPGDLEVLRDQVEGYVAGLLGLVGIAADPLTSREHILLSNLIETSWAAGRDLDLPALVGQVQTPPIRTLGVFDLDTFFPPAERTALAMRLNGLLASPSFSAWGRGEPLDIGRLLVAADGRPRCAVVTTAHLSDEERQFVTALLLGAVVAWMRRQAGTTDLRALVYMDEVAGYVPPTAVPPTKGPIMTLMKQARAFGVGMVLATQNPVDIDYRAISNAGTWMIGRLQTERDRDRLLDGMSAASGGVDVAAVGDAIAGLARRSFVLRRAGRDAPEVFTTRWAMSYLRGPMTRDQIAALTRAGAGPDAPAGAPPTPPPPPAPADGAVPVAPPVADGIPVRWIDPAAPWVPAAGGDPRGTRLAACAVARVALRYDEAAAGLVHDEEYEAVIHPLPETPDAAGMVSVDHDDRDLGADAPPGGHYVPPAAPVGERRYWTALERALADHLVRERPLELRVNRRLKVWSRPGETPDDFAVRCDAAADAAADRELAALRDRYETRVRRLREQIAAAGDRREEIEARTRDRRTDDLLSTAGSILGGLLGGRRSTRRLARDVVGGLSGGGTSSAEARRMEAAAGRMARLEGDLLDLEADLAAEVARVQAEWDAVAAATETRPVPLERTDVRVVALTLGWLPVA